MRKIFTLMTAMMLMASTSFATTIYCQMDKSWWTKDGAAIGAYAWTGEGESAVANAAWPGVRMTPVSASVWSIDIDVNQYQNIIFTRMNPSDNGDQYWAAKTKDQVVPTNGNNQFTITSDNEVWGDPGCDGTWSVYDPNANPGGGDNPGGGETPNAYWYWKGQVDGGPIENEAGGYNVFVNGLSSISVEEAAYIFVIYQVKGVQGVQYMTDGWLGMEITHATMNACGDCPNGNKLYVPAGDFTLYLYDNGDGTVELSTEVLPGKTLVGGTQAIENTPVSNKVRKAIIDGQLVIIRGEKMFDATGRQL